MDDSDSDFRKFHLALAALLMKIREALGLSQRDLGTRIGVAQATIARWETSTRVADLVDLHAFARATNRRLVVDFVPTGDPMPDVTALALSRLDGKLADLFARLAGRAEREPAFRDTLEAMVRVSPPVIRRSTKH